MTVKTLHSGALTTSDAGNAVPIQTAAGSLAVFVNATAADTLTSFDGTIEWSFDATTWWSLASADTITQITAAPATEAKVFTIKAPFVRFNPTLVGTSITLTVTAHEVG